jgi:hypothetical protein
MSTSFDRIAVARHTLCERSCFLQHEETPPVQAAAEIRAPKSEHSFPLRPEVTCLQQWLDLNA